MRDESLKVGEVRVGRKLYTYKVLRGRNAENEKVYDIFLEAGTGKPMVIQSDAPTRTDVHFELQNPSSDLYKQVEATLLHQEMRESRPSLQ